MVYSKYGEETHLKNNNSQKYSIPTRPKSSEVRGHSITHIYKTGTTNN